MTQPLDVYFKKNSKLWKTLYDFYKSRGKKTASHLSYDNWELLLSKGGLLNDFFTPRCSAVATR